MRLDKLPVAYCFPDNSPREFEVLKVLRVHTAARTGLQGHVVGGAHEESEVWRAQLAQDEAVPFLCKTASIDAYQFKDDIIL